jgi:hypothetical protein
MVMNLFPPTFSCVIPAGEIVAGLAGVEPVWPEADSEVEEFADIATDIQYVLQDQIRKLESAKRST